MPIIRPKVAWGSEALPPMITQLYALGLLVPPLAQVRDDGGGVVAVEGGAEVAPRLGKSALQRWLPSRATYNNMQHAEISISYLSIIK